MPSGVEKRRNPQRGLARKVEEKETAPQPSVEFSRLLVLCIAAWLIPGLGHWLLKRKWRALILFLSIVAMFVLGLLMQGQFFSLASPSYLERLGYVGELCAGLVMPVSRFFGYLGGNPFFISADYGTAYLISAGMLNVLSILDAYDIAMQRKL